MDTTMQVKDKFKFCRKEPVLLQNGGDLKASTIYLQQDYQIKTGVLS